MVDKEHSVSDNHIYLFSSTHQHKRSSCIQHGLYQTWLNCDGKRRCRWLINRWVEKEAYRQRSRSSFDQHVALALTMDGWVQSSAVMGFRYLEGRQQERWGLSRGCGWGRWWIDWHCGEGLYLWQKAVSSHGCSWNTQVKSPSRWLRTLMNMLGMAAN